MNQFKEMTDAAPRTLVLFFPWLAALLFLPTIRPSLHVVVSTPSVTRLHRLAILQL